MEKHLISPADVPKLARPMSIHVDPDEVNVFIDETEQMDIVPAIGAELYFELLSDIDNEKYKTLLDGGFYTDSKNKKRIFKGLRATVAYYTYARLAKNDGKILGESGLIQHQDEYYNRTENKQRIVSYNDAFNVADQYLADVLLYIKETTPSTGCCGGGYKVANKRTRIIDIGD